MTCAVCFPVETPVDNLASIRVRRAMALADLAHAAGLSLSTVHRMELGQRLPHPRNRVLIVEALVRAMPLREDEITALARDLEIDTARIVRIQESVLHRAPAQTRQAEALHRMLDELVGMHGLETAESAMVAVSAALAVRQQAREIERTLVHRSPPVQREGYVEHVETEYKPTKPAASTPKKKKRRA